MLFGTFLKILSRGENTGSFWLFYFLMSDFPRNFILPAFEPSEQIFVDFVISQEINEIFRFVFLHPLWLLDDGSSIDNYLFTRQFIIVLHVVKIDDGWLVYLLHWNRLSFIKLVVHLYRFSLRFGWRSETHLLISRQIFWKIMEDRVIHVIFEGTLIDFKPIIVIIELSISFFVH